jgi:DNA-binding response OmpR family regulator
MPTLRDARVLVVEDEVLIAMLINDVLSDAGATVVGPAASVSDALRLIEVERDTGIDAAVLDLNLMGESSMGVADRLAALGTPVVFATGSDSSAIAQRHRTIPILSKPFNCDALIAAVATALTDTARECGELDLPAVAVRPVLALPAHIQSH